MKLDISKYKAFFFDFDGVIADTVNIKTEAFGELFSKYGRAVTRNVMEYHLQNGGVSRYEKFRYYYKYFLNKKMNTSEMKRLDKAYSKLVFKKVAAAPFISGVIPFLNALRKKGASSFIISATPQAEMRRIAKFKKLNVFFDDIVGSPKSKSDNLKYLLCKYLLYSAEAIYFGDAKNDYLAAKKNRIKFIGVVNKESRELKRTPGIFKIRDFSAADFISGQVRV